MCEKAWCAQGTDRVDDTGPWWEHRLLYRQGLFEPRPMDQVPCIEVIIWFLTVLQPKERFQYRCDIKWFLFVDAHWLLCREKIEEEAWTEAKRTKMRLVKAQMMKGGLNYTDMCSVWLGDKSWRLCWQALLSSDHGLRVKERNQRSPDLPKVQV
jgi:hypothetical protein